MSKVVIFSMEEIPNSGLIKPLSTSKPKSEIS